MKIIMISISVLFVLSCGIYDPSQPFNGLNYGCTGNRCGADGKKKPGLGRVYSDGKITSLEDYQENRGLKSNRRKDD